MGYPIITASENQRAESGFDYILLSRLYLPFEVLRRLPP